MYLLCPTFDLQADATWLRAAPASQRSLLSLPRFFLGSRLAMAGSRHNSTKASISYQEVDSDVDIDKEERVAVRKGEFGSVIGD